MQENNKKFKISYLIFITIIIVLIGATYVVWYKSQEKNEEIITLEKEITKLRKNQSDDNTIDSEIAPDSTDCNFTKTYNIVEILNYVGNAGEERYIIVDAFQDKLPLILKLADSNLIVEIGKSYEITFNSNSKFSDDISKASIVNIIETDKNGMEQIQETCQ